MNLDQHRMPIVEALHKYVGEKVAPFHTPGHKQGRWIEDGWGLDKGFLKYDLADTFELDSLLDPSGIIEQAQELAADAFKADKTFFLVNGTTVGIQAMFLALRAEGKKVILPRNSHRSVVAGLIFAGLKPVFYYPQVLEGWSIPGGVGQDELERVIKENPDASGVLLLNPTYHGFTSDLKKLVELIHSYNMVAMVDEAHGAHFSFSGLFPISGIEAGADLVVQSSHKTLPAMTQASMLHLKGNRVNPGAVKEALQLLQTTSASYILLASLDNARRQMAVSGEKKLERVYGLAIEAAEKINSIDDLQCFSPIGKNRSFFSYDPTKLLVSTKKIGLSGMKSENIMRQKYFIQPELSQADNMLFLFSVSDGIKEVDTLLDGLERFSKEEKRDLLPEEPFTVSYTTKYEQALTPREAWSSTKKIIPLAEAKGMISADVVVPYPPGIPILYPGEVVTGEIVDNIERTILAGGNIQGIYDTTKKSIKVLEI